MMKIGRSVMEAVRMGLSSMALGMNMIWKIFEIK